MQPLHAKPKEIVRAEPRNNRTAGLDINPGAQPGGANAPPKFSKHFIAILTFVETFKEKR